MCDADELVSHGFKPAILSRGYFKKDKRVSFIAVSDGKIPLVPPEISGDEPFMMAESVPGAVVMAGKNRIGPRISPWKNFRLISSSLTTVSSTGRSKGISKLYVSAP